MMVRFKRLKALFAEDAERERLTAAINDTRRDLDEQKQHLLSQRSLAAAQKSLEKAESCNKEGDPHWGWVALAAAQRTILDNPNDPAKVVRAAIRLHRELGKIEGWRAKAIEDLICGSKGELRNDLEAAEFKAQMKPALCKRVIDAVELRDDLFNTTYFRILLRRRSLIQVFLFLWFVIFVCVALSYGVLPAPFDKPALVAAVVVFGCLGALLSVALGLLSSDITAKIPAQQIGSFVVWMRPAVGAAAALVAFALVYANAKLKILNSAFSEEFSAIAVVAFIAGFSERFIVGAIERITKLGDRDDRKAR